MHELSLAQALVEQIVQIAKHERASRVLQVVVVSGAYSGVERSAFEFAFPFACEQTVAEGAELSIEVSEGNAVCNQCHSVFLPDSDSMTCARCGSVDISLQGGREFTLRSVNLEIPEIAASPT